MTSLYVIVCDSGQYDYARTDVVCVTCTERAAERTCRDANAILSSGSEAADAVEVAYYHDPDDTDHDAFMERLSAVKRPFAKRLAVVVGAHFEAAFSGDETMRAVRAECLRAAEGRTAWQPIETVAVDETVLLWDPVRRGVRMGHVSIRRGCVYTHWMHLPAAPEAPHV